MTRPKRSINRWLLASAINVNLAQLLLSPLILYLSDLKINWCLKSASVVNEVLDFYIESASWPPPERKKKRKSRWANDEADKTFIPGMPTVLPADATEDQKEQYIRKYFIRGSGIIWTWNGLLTAIFPNLYESISFFIKYRVLQYVYCGDKF